VTTEHLDSTELNTDPRERRVPTELAARILGVEPGTMKFWRMRGRGPKYSKLYARCYYRVGDLEDFLADSVIDPAESRRRREEVCV
jgi:hypothetical protein